MKPQILLITLCLIISGSCQKDDDNDIEKVKDIDGNIYHTVKIGTQVWIVENLRTTKYRNGEPIPNITDSLQWVNLTTGAYCEYNNDISNVSTYGRLYNWYAVNDNRNLAPEGWHIPDYEEWQTLIEYLGGESVAGGKMKEADTVHWVSPNVGATNESGFKALPGGYRIAYATGAFYGLGIYGDWWSSTVYDPNYPTDAWPCELSNYDTFVGRYLNDVKYGKSIRCVKD